MFQRKNTYSKQYTLSKIHITNNVYYNQYTLMYFIVFEFMNKRHFHFFRCLSLL